ncbi:MCC1 [Symbiodinium sp. CCMP2592]|nr:MCC1 [Symbiodinium sp. CCMP2592]
METHSSPTAMEEDPAEELMPKSSSSAMPDPMADTVPRLTAKVHRRFSAEDAAAIPLSHIHYRPLQAEDMDEMMALHQEWFPVSYDQDFYNKSVGGHLYSLVATWPHVQHGGSASSVGGRASAEQPEESILGMITMSTYCEHHGEAISHVLGADCEAVCRRKRRRDFGSEEEHGPSTGALAYILTLGVAEAFRRRGLAKELIRRSLEYVERDLPEVQAMYLHVVTYNEAAILLYESCSFLRIEYFPSFYFLHGRHYDSYLYARYLRGIGIVTVHTANIGPYANITGERNRLYAQRHDYGFHVETKVIDKSRIPHWSKIHAVLLHLCEYDFVFWIDADAMFYDQDVRIEDVVPIGDVEKHIWLQHHSQDFPSSIRKELFDTGTVLFRSSPWTRRFLLEWYFYPPCQDPEILNYTEQYCFSEAYKADFMDLQTKTAALLSKELNNHQVPGPSEKGLFILHLSGQADAQRADYLREVLDGKATVFANQPEYADFRSFQQLFASHNYGGLASIHLCVVGIGDRQALLLDALLFHLTYMGVTTIILEGAPGLYSQLRKSDEIVGTKYGKRMALLSIEEYLSGKTIDGDPYVSGFYCDVTILGVESWRHMRYGHKLLGDLNLAGFSRDHEEVMAGRSFGASPLSDVFFAVLEDGCLGDAGSLHAEPDRLLDTDDFGGELDEACRFLSNSYLWLAEKLQRAVAGGIANYETNIEVLIPNSTSEPVPWRSSKPELWGVLKEGKVTFIRLPRAAFIVD